MFQEKNAKLGESGINAGAREKRTNISVKINRKKELDASRWGAESHRLRAINNDFLFRVSERDEVEKREAGDWNETGRGSRRSESTDAEWCL